jgi:hypothetical protein
VQQRALRRGWHMSQTETTNQLPFVVTALALASGSGVLSIYWIAYIVWASNSGFAPNTGKTFLALTAIEASIVAAILFTSVSKRIGWRRILARMTLIVWSLSIVNVLLLVTVIRVY